MKLGSLELISLSDGFFRLDGGAMFGVVPKPLWEKRAPADARNRIRLGLRPLLVRGEKTMIIDAGIGGKMSAKNADIYGLERERHLDHSLQDAGLRREDIQIVVATHLHFDHAGGFTTRLDTGDVVPAFPRARYVIRTAEWEDATHTHERNRASYIPDDFLPLAATGVVDFMPGDGEVMPGVRVLRSGGHVMHHQVVLIQSGGRTAVFTADMVPTTAHIDDPWIMGYDLYPMDTLAFKRRFLREAIEKEYLVFFEHDPDVAAGYIRERSGRRLVEPLAGWPAGASGLRDVPDQSMSITIGIIGGSGLYEMAELTGREERRVSTPFGEPSAPYVLGTLRGKRVAFLARHGAGHRLLPSELNFRANIFGFKTLGVEYIVSASAVGSLKQEYKPTDLVIPDQFFDRTRGRLSTFFGRGLVAHVGFAHPFCARLSDIAFRSAQNAGATVHRGGTYVCMEGPQFSTLAESQLYRAWGMDIIGMTNLQEAKLAREAEICYTTIALVTDYDCWHPDHESVTVEMIIANLTQNATTAQQVIATAVGRLPFDRTCECASALKYAIITRPEAVPEETRRQLAPIVGKYM